MPSILNATTTNGLVTSADNSGSLQLQTNNGTTAVTIDTSQNVGIGTSSPSQKLDVSGTAQSNQYIINPAVNTTTPQTGVSFYQLAGVGPAVSGFQFAVITGNDNSRLERMRITSGGDLLVGTSSPINAAKFEVFQNTANWAVGIRNNANNSGIYITNGSGTAVYTAMGFYNNGTSFSTCGTISVSGSSTAYNTSSDYRLKENIAPMTGALAKVSQLKPVTYTWKSDGSAGQGFIAHELQAVVPDAVTGEKDAVNEDGSIKPQGVDTSFLVATLTAAIQEQQAQIEELKAKVSALEGAK